MVRNYTKKSSRGEWDKTAMMAALAAVVEGRMTTFAAANAYNVPATTLRRRLKKNDDEMPVHGGRFREVFDEVQLEYLKKYLTAIDQVYSGMTKQQCRRLVFDFAEHCKIAHPFNRETKMAGEDWLANFMKHFKLTLRPPDATSAARAIDFTEPTADELFSALKQVREKYKFPACAIYNVDESTPSTVPEESLKATPPTGSKRLSKVPSADRGKNDAVIRFINATGTHLPAFLTFARKRMQPALVERISPRTRPSTDDEWRDIWNNGEMFVQFLNDLSLHVGPTAESPLVLLLDDHQTSHITQKAIDLCRENHIVMVGSSPQAPHRLQQLDDSFFSSLSADGSRAGDHFMVTHPEQPTNDQNIADVLATAYRETATVGNTASVSRGCGIEPYNDALSFSEHDFDPSETSDRSLVVDDNEGGRVSPQATTSGPSGTSDEPASDYETERDERENSTSRAKSRPIKASDESFIVEHQRKQPMEQRSSSSTAPHELKKSKRVLDSNALLEDARAKKRIIQNKCDSGITRSPVKMMLVQREEWKAEQKRLKQQRKEARALNKKMPRNPKSDCSNMTT